MTTTTRLFSSVAVAAALASTVTCVFPDVGLGKACEQQSDCFSPHVCIRVDPEDEGDGNVCLPMLEVDAPQACTEDADCAAAGFPIDSSCDGDGRCACGDVDDGFACDGFDEVVGEHTCRCLTASLLTDEECEDDNQCLSLHCGDGNCVDGVSGDGCDSDEDCPDSETSTCVAGACA